MKHRLFALALIGCTGLAQAASLGGHLSATLEADTISGQARDLGADLLVDDWLIGAYATGRDVSYKDPDGSARVRTQNAGAHLSYQGTIWGAGLAYNHYDDGELVTTREWAGKASWQRGGLRISAKLHQRQHDLDLTLGQRSLSDAFSSTGLGLGLRWQFDNQASIYGNAIHYDYSKDQVLEDTLRRLRQLYFQQPLARRRIRAAYFSVQGANAQVRGNLIANGYSAGFDYPVGEHWLSANYTLNQAEVDGSLSQSVSLYWSHTLDPQWALDIYTGYASGDLLVSSGFAGLTLHWFID